MVDGHTNTLIVQALEDDIKNMLPLVAELDLPTPQILIEAHIVEANSTTARELGVQWGGQWQIDSKNTIGSGAASSGTGGNVPNVPSGNYAFNFPANVGDAAGMAVGFLYQDAASTLVAQLSALQNERKLKILSSPSITTIDNQKAIFESGEEVPYQSVDDGNVKTEFKEALLKLEVTPHVIDGEALKLAIKVNKDEVDKTVTNNPPIITKKAETTVILYDGQTTVIGGLNSANDSRLDSGVPGLKEIPLLGALFRGEATERSLGDVMIFITPHILKQRIGGGAADRK
jgi:type IV pilus assembly protein PilQ